MPAERIASGALILDRCYAITLATSDSVIVPARILKTPLLSYNAEGEAGYLAHTSHMSSAHLLLWANSTYVGMVITANLR